MSVLLVSYCMAAPKKLVQLLNLLDHLRFYILSTLFYLIGFSYRSSNNVVQSGRVHHPRPPQPWRTAVDPSFIKSQLPLIDFQNYCFMASTGTAGAEGERRACVFCLEELDAGDRVRELGSCRHSFHGECIDRWIDLGHFTCPTCRADLLPQYLISHFGDKALVHAH